MSLQHRLCESDRKLQVLRIALASAERAQMDSRASLDAIHARKVPLARQFVAAERRIKIRRQPKNNYRDAGSSSLADASLGHQLAGKLRGGTKAAKGKRERLALAVDEKSAPSVLAVTTPAGQQPIGVPDFNEALRAAADDSLYTPTFTSPSFRAHMVQQSRGPPPSVPRTPGESRLGYLISRDASRATGFNGFIMWRETWGKRNSYSVDLLQLSYVTGESQLGLQLIASMGTQLEKGRSSTTVSTKLAEKVSVELVTAWRALGFNGIPGSEIMTMQLP